MMKEVIEQLKAYHVEILAESQKDIAPHGAECREESAPERDNDGPDDGCGRGEERALKGQFQKAFLVHVNPLDLEVIRSSGEEVKRVLDNVETLEFTAVAAGAGGRLRGADGKRNGGRSGGRQYSEVEEAVLKAIDGDKM